MKALALSALWFICGAAWLNPAVLGWLWPPQHDVYVMGKYKGNLIFGGYATAYRHTGDWLFLHVGGSWPHDLALRVDEVGVADTAP